MRLTMAEKRLLIKSFAPPYRKKGKKVKGEVLTSDSAQSKIELGSSPGVLIDCKKGKEPALRETFGGSFG